MKATYWRRELFIFTIKNVDHTLVDELGYVQILVVSQLLLQTLGAISKRPDELFENI